MYTPRTLYHKLKYQNRTSSSKVSLNIGKYYVILGFEQFSSTYGPIIHPNNPHFGPLWWALIFFILPRLTRIPKNWKSAPPPCLDSSVSQMLGFRFRKSQVSPDILVFSPSFKKICTILFWPSGQRRQKYVYIWKNDLKWQSWKSKWPKLQFFFIYFHFHFCH